MNELQVYIIDIYTHPHTGTLTRAHTYTQYYRLQNPHIRVICEGSCDTEAWSNDAENSALITGIHYTLLYIHIEDSYFKL